MERQISDMASVFNEILTFVRGSAQGIEIGEVERRLLAMVMELGRAALEEFVAEKGTGYQGKQIMDAQGSRRASRSWMHRVAGGRMSVTGAVRIGPSSERSPSVEPTITVPVHAGSFP
jgi:hypothetical protein